MALVDETEQQGRWLFRWRSYVPLPMLAVILWAMADYRYPAGRLGLERGW